MFAPGVSGGELLSLQTLRNLVWRAFKEAVIDLHERVGDSLSECIARLSDCVFRSITRRFGQIKTLFADNLLGNLNRPDAKVTPVINPNAFVHSSSRTLMQKRFYTSIREIASTAGQSPSTTMVLRIIVKRIEFNNGFSRT
ncbi:hypothetical protein NXC24_PB00135 (plasmid) [Rhizobium sp. NXC24]|nr:hypothetical protein NXC24_PB00135 [Rhizobium sp. NXC24]